MVIIGTPKTNEMNQYFMADGLLAFRLHQAGFIPKYNDEGCLYFKINKKLEKFLSNLDKSKETLLGGNY